MRHFTRLALLICPLLFYQTGLGQYYYGSPESAAYDPIRNRYLISDQANGDIIEIDSLGIETFFNRDLSIAKGLIIRNDTLFCAAGYQGLAAFNLATGELILLHYIPGMVELNDIAADSSGNLYLSDAQGDMIHKVHLSDLATETIVTNFKWANGLWFDPFNNRLIAVRWVNDCPISAINLNDYSITTIRNDGLDLLDGITRDQFGNYYISAFGTDAVHRYDSLFSSPPVTISTGHTDPGDLHFNPWKNEFAVPCVSGHRVDFVSEVGMTADYTFGLAPLQVNFNGSCIFNASSYRWLFGDSDSSLSQNPAYLYSTPGSYTVTLTAYLDTDSVTCRKSYFISALADTLAAFDVKFNAGEQVEMTVNLSNNAPLRVLKIPIEYQGPLELEIDSVSLAGCRTEIMDTIYEIASDPYNRRICFMIKNNSMSKTPILMPGDGPVMKLFFSAANPLPGQFNPVFLDGYSSYLPLLYSIKFNYAPAPKAGAVSLFVCGDADDNGAVNILDITYLIKFLYKNGPELPWPAQGDNNADSALNIRDITALINFCYKSGPPPVCL